MIRSCSAWIGEQRRLPGERDVLGDVLRVEDLVLDAGDRAAAGGEMAAHAHAERRRRRRLVERARLRRPPVEQQRPVLLVAQPDPADVAEVALVGLQAPEGEPLVDLTEAPDAVLEQPRHGVALAAGLMGARRAAPPGALQLVDGLGPERVEALVQAGDVGLLASELAVGP
jgi:hypothetical protein